MSLVGALWLPGAALTAPALFLAGAAASPHCLLTSGAIGVPGAGPRAGCGAASATRLPLAQQLLWLHLGRLAGYGILGATAGALGQSLLPLLPEPAIGHLMQVLATGALVVLGGRLAWRRHRDRNDCCEPQRPADTRKPGTMARHFTHGLAWSALPCALLYSVLLLAALSGNARDGAMLAFAFGLGGLPLLAGFGWFCRREITGPRARRWSGIGLILAGVLGGTLLLLDDSRYAAWCRPEGSEPAALSSSGPGLRAAPPESRARPARVAQARALPSSP